MRRIKKRWIVAPLILGVLLFATVLFTGPNFHVVTAGVLYRSKQLSGKQFDRYIRDLGIKTVINLRGASAGSSWYDEELAVTTRNNAVHYDFQLSAVRYVPPSRLDSIMRIAAACPRPILVHCKGGADRTGLFCSAWRLTVEGQPKDKAARQLTFLYGHVPLFHKNTWAMDSSYFDYVRFLGAHTNRSFP